VKKYDTQTALVLGKPPRIRWRLLNLCFVLIRTSMDYASVFPAQPHESMTSLLLRAQVALLPYEGLRMDEVFWSHVADRADRFADWLMDVRPIWVRRGIQLVVFAICYCIVIPIGLLDVLQKEMTWTGFKQTLADMHQDFSVAFRQNETRTERRIRELIQKKPVDFDI